MTKENRRHNIALVLEKGRRDLENARLLLEAGGYDAAVSLCYYAVYHHAQALLLADGVEARSHSGLAHLLNVHFVRRGRLDPRHSRTLAFLFSQRQAASYDAAAVITEDMGREALGDAEGFLEAARARLGDEGWVSPE